MSTNYIVREFFAKVWAIIVLLFGIFLIFFSLIFGFNLLIDFVRTDELFKAALSGTFMVFFSTIGLLILRRAFNKLV